ncbi:MAG: roadblock/LC7 domain-containing protein [candidate division KSB1 bacterium]|nr:roadblock/LC7 domain-containing protein [candidate division KSB1 bacterium]
MVELAGVTGAAIVGRDGFVIESVTSGDVDLEALGAIVSTGFGAAEIMGTEMKLGYLTQTMFEYDVGKILMASCGDSVLAIVTDTSAVVGNVRHHIRKNIAELAKLL